MFSCRDAMGRASKALDEPLPLRSRWSLRSHLMMCSACRAAFRQMKALDSLVGGRFAQDDEAEAPVSTPVPDRVRRALRQASKDSRTSM